MNEIVKVFNDRPVRIIDQDGELWFVAKDVCKVLEIKLQANSTRYLDDDERGVCLINTPSGEQEMTIINEPGLYSLILRSRKAEAKAFKRWVTHDVLPSIRKTGAYLSPAISDRQVEALITTLEQEVCRRIAAEQEMKCLQRQLEKLALAALPKSAFGEPSRTTGLPKDKVISTHLRSSRRPHRPQVEKYIQLLLPLYAARELLAEALLPALGAGALETKEERNA
jgi:anti-repressor protein